MGVKTLKKVRVYHFSLTMHPVTIIYWTHGCGALIQHIAVHKFTGRILLMHGKFTGRTAVKVRALYAYIVFHGANSGSVEKKLTRWLTNQIAGILEPIL